jgi:hypothetical protein
MLCYVLRIITYHYVLLHILPASLAESAMPTELIALCKESMLWRYTLYGKESSSGEWPVLIVPGTFALSEEPLFLFFKFNL